MHRKSALVASDSFVSEHRLLLSIIVSIHDECELMLVWMDLGSCSELSSIESDKSSVNFHVRFIGKEDSSFLYDNSL